MKTKNLFFSSNISVSLRRLVETETGSAGEQPVRDTLDERRKCRVREGFHAKPSWYFQSSTCLKKLIQKTPLN